MGTNDGTGVATVADGDEGGQVATVTTPAPNLKGLSGGLARLASMFKMDTDKVENGAWMDFGENTRIRVRRDSSTKAIEARDRLVAPLRPALAVGAKMSKAQNEAFSTAWAAEGLTAEWENIGDGEEAVECTPENAAMIYAELPELRDAVIEFSGKMQNYRPD